MQAIDQKWEKGNLALQVSSMTRTPVRVFRGGKHGAKDARQYVYDGLYIVKEAKIEVIGGALKSHACV